MNDMVATGHPERVAIVGIGCRFPGGASDAASFWRLLIERRDAIAEIPADRIDVTRFFAAAPATPGRMMTRWGGYLERIDEFDAGFFGVSPREAERMDPQQRLLLETAWEALEDSGQDVDRIDRRRAGVFVGQWISDFEARLFTDPEDIDFFMTTGSGRYAASGRVSYLLGFRGPSLTIDTACSSSLAAVHLAVRSIRNGECSLALAGGVNVILQPHISIGYSQSRMMAPDGRCKFGDASGDGYVRSEGAALIVLKPLERALADGDRIYAVIRGGAINNDGRSSGSMGTPSRTGQEELLRAAYDDARLPPGLVGYIEAHGTGTRVGDPVELGALGAVIGAGRTAGSRAFVGSVKTNIGHTEGAAGIAGLIKAALTLYHGVIPPSLHFREPNPAIRWSELACEIPRAATPWPAQQHPRFAGVSAFGIAGSNGHIVLEEGVAGMSRATAASRATQLLPLSARSPVALRKLAERYAEHLSASDPGTLRDICWSAGTRRTCLDHRAAFVAASTEAMVEMLRGYAEDQATAAADEVVHAADRPRLAFVVPGQGAQWIGMARELLEREPVFRSMLEQCGRAAQPYTDWSILEQLAAEPGSEAFKLDRIDVIQPVLVAIAIAYAELLRSLGVEPDAVVGHSMGEVGAAYIAGALDLDQAMQVICRRSSLMRRVSGQGAMALVELPLADLAARLAGFEDRVSPAASNSPRSSVISGQPEAVRLMLAKLEADGVFCRLVKVDVASHSTQMEPLAAELAADLADLRPAETRIPIYSTALGRVAAGPEFDASYWAINLRQPVLFADAVQALAADGVTIFVELGPHPVLLSSVQQTVPDATTVVCGHREQPDQQTLLSVIARLWAAGYPIDWQRIMPEGGCFVPLPLYPWCRERYWAEAAEMRRGAPGEHVAPLRLDEEASSWLYHLQWQVAEHAGPLRTAAAVHANWLVLADDSAAGAALEAAFAAAGAKAIVAPLAHSEDALRRIALTVSGAAGIVVLASACREAAFLPLRVLQACLQCTWHVQPRLWFATTGGQAVIAEPAERVSVDQAALWGAARVIAEEHPDLWGGLLDLDPVSVAHENAEFLVGHVLSPDAEVEAAVRAGQRYMVRLHRDDRTRVHQPLTCRPDAAYLITGGLGDIGIIVAEALAKRGARRLILLGRTPLPPRAMWRSVPSDSPGGGRIAAVRALEQMGVAVHTAAVDVGDEAALRTFLECYEAEGWPPIKGVFHTAVSLANELASSMSRLTFDAVLTTKLGGARLLDRLLTDLDLFVVFSSIGGFLPHPGVANYAAANAGLDALAQDRRARDQPALSIAWGPWENAGLALGEAGAHAVTEMARQGIAAIPSEQGGKLFAWLCGCRVSTTAVMPVNWSQFRHARGGRIGPAFKDLVAGEGDAGRSSVLSQLDGADPTQRRAILEQVVKEVVGRVLKIAPARLDTRKELGNLGLGSLLAIELRNHLETALGRPLSATLAWNYPTVEAMVAYFAADRKPAVATAADGTTEQPADALLDSLNAVAALSDEEAALALIGQAGDGSR